MEYPTAVFDGHPNAPVVPVHHYPGDAASVSLGVLNQVGHDSFEATRVAEDDGTLRVGVDRGDGAPRAVASATG